MRLAISCSNHRGGSCADGDDDRHRYRSKLARKLVLRSIQVPELGSKLALVLGSKLVLEPERSKQVLELRSKLALAGSNRCHDHDDDDLLQQLARTSLPVPELQLRGLHSSSCFSSKGTELESQCSNIENSVQA